MTCYFAGGALGSAVGAAAYESGGWARVCQLGALLGVAAVMLGRPRGTPARPAPLVGLTDRSDPVGASVGSSVDGCTDPDPHPGQLALARRPGPGRDGRVRPRRRPRRRRRSPALPRVARPQLASLLRGGRRGSGHRGGRRPAARPRRPASRWCCSPPGRMGVQRHTHDWLVRNDLRWDLLVMRDIGDYDLAAEFKRAPSTSCGPPASSRSWPSRTTSATSPCSAARHPLRLHPLRLLRLGHRRARPAGQLTYRRLARGQAVLSGRTSPWRSSW